MWPYSVSMKMDGMNNKGESSAGNATLGSDSCGWVSDGAFTADSLFSKKKEQSISEKK